MKIILGTSDAWSISCLSQQPNPTQPNPAYHIEDCRILRMLLQKGFHPTMQQVRKRCSIFQLLFQGEHEIFSLTQCIGLFSHTFLFFANCRYGKNMNTYILTFANVNQFCNLHFFIDGKISRNLNHSGNRSIIQRLLFSLFPTQL